MTVPSAMNPLHVAVSTVGGRFVRLCQAPRHLRLRKSKRKRKVRSRPVSPNPVAMVLERCNSRESFDDERSTRSNTELVSFGSNHMTAPGGRVRAADWASVRVGLIRRSFDGIRQHRDLIVAIVVVALVEFTLVLGS